MGCEWSDNIFGVSDHDFQPLALEIFRFQYERNAVYRSFVDALHIAPAAVKTLSGIPFLPISFFKTHKVVTGDFESEITFRSSGTTQSGNSEHHVKDVSLYERSFLETFNHFYGNVTDWCILGLLPSYLERKDSSLVYMVDHLIKWSGDKRSGFYLDDHEKLKQILVTLEGEGKKTMLIGVSFALLDFTEKYKMILKHTTVMETGGMKGRRVEITREELHETLKNGFGVSSIHSEYGMTELLSQAYSTGEGLFNTPPWMKLLVRDEEDPLTLRTEGRGVINVIDLANVHSCAFIATDDAGRIKEWGSFEVLGRIDYSDARGCSLLLI